MNAFFKKYDIFLILKQSRSRQFNGQRSTERRNCIHDNCLPEKFPSLVDIWPESLEAFGDWHKPQYCPHKSDLATGFKFGWEPAKGGDIDDTGGNGFWLHCNGIEDNPASQSYVIGRSGDFSERFHTASCRKGDYLYGIQVHSEPFQRKGDDTTLNNVRLWCKNHQSGTEYQLSEPKAPMWGSWTARVNCPKYYGMSGIKLCIEAWEEDNDDTSLGWIVPYCKPITLFADVSIDKRR